MLPWMSSADPGRVHREGRTARFALEDARDQVAALFGTRSRQVIFTSSATEAINAASYGVLGPAPGGHVVLSRVEHSAVLESSKRFATGVIDVGVDRGGLIDMAQLESAVGRADVALVQCQMANHEVGTIQPAAEVAALCRQHGVRLHIDAAAAAGHLPIQFDQMGADLMSVSAHKLGGPRGIGALLIKRGLRITPMLQGGAQERARRAGLENVAAAVGFGAAAAELAGGGRLQSEAADAARNVDQLREVVESMADVEIYGPSDRRLCLPHLLCIGVGGVEAEPILIGLDQAGIAAHSGSSCSSESLEPSPVLEAMGVDSEHSLRLSVGWSTTPADLARAAEALPRVVSGLRALMAGG
jgi:cysteine desulfurase